MDRLKSALMGKTRGKRSTVGNGRQFAEVRKGDLAECCAKIEPGKDAIVDGLRKGSQGEPERMVYIYADDLFHLLDMVTDG